MGANFQVIDGQIKSFEEIKHDVILETIEHQTFLIELESIKYNLNLE